MTRTEDIAIKGAAAAEKPAIDTVIFDMGGVLIDFAPDKFVERYPVLSEDEKRLLANEVFKSGPWSLLDFGEITEEEEIGMVCERVPERLHKVVEDLVRTWDDPIIPMPGMAELTAELKENGYRLLLLSNAGPRHDEYWPKIPGSENFEGKVVSAYERLFKPQTEIFELLIKRFGVDPKRAVFIDDSPPNCAGAMMCGLDAIVFRSCEDLRDELRRRGVCI